MSICTPDVPTRERLRRTVRAAAAAAHNETSFVERIRAAELVLRPRFAPGEVQHVIGYAVRGRRDGIDSGPWVGGGGDLSIAALRARHWRDSPSGRAVALAAWHRTNITGTRWSTSRPADADIGRWWQAAYDATRWHRALAEIPVTDRVRWDQCSGQLTGLLAAWSEVLEDNRPGPFAAALRELTRFQHRPDPSDRRGHHLATAVPGHLARMLLDHSPQVRRHDPRRTAGDNTAPESPLLAVLFNLLGGTTAALKELERAHRARNETARGSTTWFATILLDRVRADWQAELCSPRFPWDTETFETFFASAGMTHLLPAKW